MRTPESSTRPANRGATQLPGSKAREYPHSSGDRNTFPPRRRADKGTSGGGAQKVAPTDLPRSGHGRGGED